MEPGAEQRRMETVGHPEASLDEAGPWWTWGPYLSERAWGSVREDYSASGDAWSYFPHDHARSRAYRWNEDGLAGPVHPAPGPLLRARLLERRGPDPQGADLRAGRAGGQPRRGRQGVLVVPRRHPQPLLPEVALPLPAARLPLRRPGRGERPTRPDPARVRAARHRHLRRGPLLEDRGDLRQGRPDRPLPPDPRHQRGSGRSDPARAAAPVVPRHLVVGRPPRRRRTIQVDGGPDGDLIADHPRAGTYRLAAAPGPDGVRPDAAVLRQRDQQPADLRRRGRRRAYPKDAHQRPRGRRRRHGEPGADRHEVRLVVPRRGPGRRDPRAAAAAVVPHRRRPLRARAGRGSASTRCSPTGRPRPTSSTPT